MKIPLLLLAVVALALGAAWHFAPVPDPALSRPRTDLPWQVKPLPGGDSRVFDLDLGRATLADAEAKFGPAQHLAVFEHDARHGDLEAYFGKVQFGPLQAKVVVRLHTSEALRRSLMAQAKERSSSPTGDWKYVLNDDAGAHLQQHRISAISYIPATRGLDRPFFLRRFGRPAATLDENRHAVSWFYPKKGLSILIDRKGPEVLEYVPPRAFVMPEGVTPYR